MNYNTRVPNCPGAVPYVAPPMNCSARYAPLPSMSAAVAIDAEIMPRVAASSCKHRVSDKSLASNNATPRGLPMYPSYGVGFPVGGGYVEQFNASDASDANASAARYRPRAPVVDYAKVRAGHTFSHGKK
jgi:hypothetical protein